MQRARDSERARARARVKQGKPGGTNLLQMYARRSDCRVTAGVQCNAQCATADSAGVLGEHRHAVAASYRILMLHNACVHDLPRGARHDTTEA
ncbi:hypothetical protein EON67_06250 [archaeon]|nr:MAG: hypothetical protein EON67_06250 [archaeon]